MLTKILRFVMFSHVGPLINLGLLKPLDFEDLPELPLTFTHKPFDYPLPTHSIKAFLAALLKTHKGLFSVMIVMQLCCACLNLAGPFLIKHLLKAVESRGDALGFQIFLAKCLGLTAIIASIVFQHYIYFALRSSILTVNNINQAIINKVLVLDLLARNRKPTGDLINLIGTDAEIVGDATFVAIDFIVNLFLIGAVCVSLCILLGYAGLFGIFTLFILFPLTHYLIKKINKISTESLLHRDRRVAQLGQYLSGIRIIKYFNWESEVIDSVKSIRDVEVNHKKRLSLVQGWSTLLYASTSVVVAINCFLGAFYLGVPLDVGTIFASISLFGLLQGPFANMPYQIIHLTNAQVSLGRLLDFLRLPIKESSEKKKPAQTTESQITLKKMSLQYSDVARPALHQINLQFHYGESVAIVGHVGAGKTSLLLMLLGELKSEAGESCLLPSNASVGYCSQDPLILNRTILENILFGQHSLDDSSLKLSDLLFDCCLDKDLEKLPSGLLTEIGENGINLSGGQKQRLALARCGFKNPDFLLLDDPLSAVDGETESLLVKRLLFGRWAKKTRIVVTHRLQHLNLFDQVIFLDAGQVRAQGSHHELIKSNAFYQNFMNHRLKNSDQPEPMTPSNLFDIKPPSTPFSSKISRITDDEDRARGAVSLSIFKRYILALIQSRLTLEKSPLRLRKAREKSRTILNFGLLIGVSILAVLSPIFQNLVLARWSNQSQLHNNQLPQLNILSIIGSYSGFGILVLVVTLVSSLIWSYRSLAASQKLHHNALTSLLKTSVGFFDATPIGRILNRFSRDVDNLDSPLPSALQKTFSHFLNLIISMTILIAIVNHMAIIVLPALGVFYWLQRRYRASSREIQRLMSISRSPRFSQFKELLQGLVVIRAFGHQKAFANQFMESLYNYQKAFHSILLANRWFSIRVPLLAGMISLAALLGVIFAARNNLVLIGSVGLLLTYAMRFWEHLNWAVRDFSDVESRMTSVERIQHFVDLPPEPETVGPPSPLPCGWPRSGSLEFKSVSVRYTPDSPTILKRLSFNVPSGSKVGIIGRTGSGKSTIIQSLYRMTIPYEGTIFIDGFPINSVPLKTLRRSMAIIPQDPRLFRGSLRKNIDMFGRFSDQELWSALEKAHLKTFMTSIPDQLNGYVEEDGSNFSQGQRQLICLARALLLEVPLVILDEATASVDVVTDLNIQKTIFTAFKDKTVFIIAHRLDTLRFCDRVFEIEDGQLKEESLPTF